MSPNQNGYFDSNSNVSKRKDFLALFVCLFFPVLGLGQSLYWDLNASSAGSGGPAPAGMWDSTSLNWNLNSAGGLPGTAAWVPGASAIFSAGSDAIGSYSITVTGTQLASGITFKDGTATLTGGTISLNAGSILNVTPGHSAEIDSVIAGSGSWTNTSSGILTLGGANTISGPLTITGGKTIFNANAAAGTGGIIVSPTASVFLQNAVSSTTLANPLLLNEGQSVDISALSGSFTFSGDISGNRTSLTVGGQGGNTVVFAAANDFLANLELKSGTLVITHDKALGDVSGITIIDSGATLGIQGNVTYSTTETVNLWGDGVSNLGALRNLSGVNTFFGPLNLQSSVTLGADSGSLELARAISGPGLNINKVGSGTLILSGVGNSFGAATVAGGTLVANSTLGAGTVSVNAGATLAGRGSIAGNVLLSGAISPGASPGAISTGTETWNGGAFYVWEINDADFGSAGQGLGWDLINVTNGAGAALNITATSADPVVLKITSLDLANNPGTAADFENTSDYSFTILHTLGGITGFSPSVFTIDTSAFANPLGYGLFLLQQSGNDLELLFVQKPHITSPPSNVTADECTSASFSVAATGSATLHYYWSHNNSPVGTDSPVLNLSSLSTTDAGTYKVVVFNFTGFSDSASASLTVNPAAPPVSCKPASVNLNAAGEGSIQPSDVCQSLGSDSCGAVTLVSVAPTNFTVCNVGDNPVTVTVSDAHGHFNSCIATVTVNPPATAPSSVYVDLSYGITCGPVSFPNVGGTGTYYVGYNAFATIQAAANAVAPGGTIHVAPGTYVQNITIPQTVTILGPNAGLAGDDPARTAEALLIPDVNDPENTPILSVEASGVLIDGLLFDGHNPSFGSATYDANGTSVSAAAAIQNGVFGSLVNVDHLTVQNCVMRNISYDGIYLELPLGTVNGFNYIQNNLFENMWEGLQTYAVHSVIAGNTFTNLNRGLSLHGTTVAASPGFTPVISNNVLTIAQWWPTTDLPSRLRAQGIWLNYRRLEAAPLQIVGNTINTPVAAPPGKTIRGLQALTVDGNGSLAFIGNVVNGMGNCNQGFYATYCNNAVLLIAGSLNNIKDHGVLAQTLDPDWGVGNSLLTVSNVSISMAAGGTGVMAQQDPTTPSNIAQVTVIGGTSISGGATGIQVTGANASATVKGSSVTGAAIGVDVSAGRALLEHNTLAGNTAAGIQLETGTGAIDAGDCLGGNITGLGTGTGLNGSSAGLNDLSGYAFGAVPWAINNLGSVTIPAYQNQFGALPGDSISASVSGLVDFSQAGGTLVACPATLFVQCVGDIPAGTNTLAGFNALGGVLSANQGTLSYSDNPAAPSPGDQLVIRTYNFTDLCGNTGSCQQDIIVHDLTPPTVVCPSTIVQAVNAGQHFATVTFSVSASDNCGLASVTASPPSGFNFPAGTNNVLVTALDINHITNTCAFTILVVDLPLITSPPVSLTNLAGTTVHFTVTASSPTPINYQWKKGNTPLNNTGNISGATTATLTLSNISPSDDATYSLDVLNLAGTSTASATLTVAIRPTVVVQNYSGGSATLSLTGTPGLPYGIQGSTDFVHWTGLRTNAAPYIFQDVTPLPYRFYRGVLNP